MNEPQAKAASGMEAMDEMGFENLQLKLECQVKELQKLRSKYRLSPEGATF